jgi:hypothetical protein
MDVILGVYNKMQERDKNIRCFRCGILLDPLPHRGARNCKRCFMGEK